jgi:hypothetical protein
MLFRKMIVQVFFDDIHAVMRFRPVLFGKRPVSEKSEGIHHDGFAHQMNDFRVCEDSFFPEILNLMAASENKVICVYIKALHDFVSAQTDKADIHIGKILA